MFEEKLLEPHFTSVLAPYMLDVVEQKRALGNKYNAGVEALSAFDSMIQVQFTIFFENAYLMPGFHTEVEEKGLVSMISGIPLRSTF